MVQPTVVEREWVYVCPRKHRNLLPLQEQPHACTYCGVSAFPQAEYRCEIHGEFSASLRFERDADNMLRVSELKLPGQEWQAVEMGLACPQCKRMLTRLPEDPLNRKVP